MKRAILLCVPLVGIGIGVLLLGFGKEDHGEADPNRPRVVSLNLNMTETIFALGAGEMLVGRDSLSVYPPAARKVKDLGTYGQLNLEAILSTRPTHVFGTSMVSEEKILQPLAHTGVQTEYIPFANNLDECYGMIRKIAATLGVEPRGEKLVGKIKTDLAPIRAKVKALDIETPPQVLCLFFHGTRSGMIFGKGSSHDGLLHLVGAEAAFDIAGPKPMTPEAIFGTKADAILMNREEWDMIGGEEGLLNVPGVSQIPAGKTRKFIVLPRRLVIAFGPEIAAAAAEVYKGLYEVEGPYVVDIDENSPPRAMSAGGDEAFEWTEARKKHAIGQIEKSSYPSMMTKGLIEKIKSGELELSAYKRLGFTLEDE